jgi:hypothetical protein
MDLPRERRLTQIQPRRSARKSAGVDNSCEGAQVPKVHYQ